MLELQDPEIFRAVLESVQTGVYLVDREGKIRFWNDGGENHRLPASRCSGSIVSR
jgi:PAS domain-containing protein